MWQLSQLPIASITSSAWPPYIFKRRPVSGFHSLIFLSDPDVIAYDPSTVIVRNVNKNVSFLNCFYAACIYVNDLPLNRTALTDPWLHSTVRFHTKSVIIIICVLVFFNESTLQFVLGNRQQTNWLRLYISKVMFICTVKCIEWSNSNI